MKPILPDRGCPKVKAHAMVQSNASNMGEQDICIFSLDDQPSRGANQDRRHGGNQGASQRDEVIAFKRVGSKCTYSKR